jgi:deazaflavin-dependent oxidoreductase (nitroreductase family)
MIVRAEPSRSTHKVFSHSLSLTLGILVNLLRRMWNPIVQRMNLKDGSVLVGTLTTIGRKSGSPRTVELRLVYTGGRFYASSSKVAGKHWCQNMIKNPAIEITVKGEHFSCTAKQVSDDELRQRILTLRDSASRVDRAVFEMVPK